MESSLRSFRSIGRGWPSASLKCYAGFLASLLWYLGLKPATAPMQHASRYLLAIELRMHWPPIRGWRNLCAKRQERSIPRTYYSVGLLVLVIAAGLYSQITAAARRLPSLFFFAMGAGFLLLETQLVSRLALFFGTVWQVIGIVISALLL